jgi:hypothetical protein
MIKLINFILYTTGWKMPESDPPPPPHVYRKTFCTGNTAWRISHMALHQTAVNGFWWHQFTKLLYRGNNAQYPHGSGVGVFWRAAGHCAVCSDMRLTAVCSDVQQCHCAVRLTAVSLCSAADSSVTVQCGWQQCHSASRSFVSCLQHKEHNKLLFGLLRLWTIITVDITFLQL